MGRTLLAPGKAGAGRTAAFFFDISLEPELGRRQEDGGVRGGYLAAGKPRSELLDRAGAFRAAAGAGYTEPFRDRGRPDFSASRDPTFWGPRVPAGRCISGRAAPNIESPR